MQEIQGSTERKGNPVAVKSLTFASKIIACCRQLNESGVEFVLTRQLVRSGTSIVANIEEAIGGHTRAEFASKMGIAYKEARECAYWIRLLVAANTLPENRAIPLLRDVDELLRIIGAIRQSLKKQRRINSYPHSHSD